MKKQKTLWEIIKHIKHIKKAIKIALVVGIILNLINQGEVLFIMAMDDLNYYKFFLTFIVPFCVSMYTAVSNEYYLEKEKNS